MTAATIPAPIEPQQPSRDEATALLAARLLEASVGALDMFAIHLGRQLGLYRSLAEDGPATPDLLASRTGIAPRYAREWLEQQAVSGFLTVDDPSLPEGARRYALPEAYVPVLLDELHPAHVGPMAEMLVGTACAVPAVLDAYKSGGGVPFECYGADFRHGQGAVNRKVFAHELTGVWLPAMPDLHARLGGNPPARIADLGCGVGWSTIALARAYPHASVTGYDLDAASIAEASAHAADAGVTVSFARKDAAALAADGPFDAIVIVQALHDMSRPGDVLAELRRALAPDGSLVVAEPRVAERFTAPGDVVERLFYGFSIVHCLPAALADAPSHPTGTVIREGIVRDLALGAGFASCEVIPVESLLFRLYRLRTR